jgi:RNA polymerase-binding transcription factor DksA
MSAHLVAPRVGADSHLSPVALSMLRALLLCELVAQLEQADNHRAASADMEGQTDVDSVFERELADASAARADEAVNDIRHALTRLEDGTYGICERCSAAVPLERLEIIPHARSCVACPGRTSGLLG